MTYLIQDICAFSDCLHKLYSVSDPLDGVKAMLPSLGILFRSRHVGMDLLPSNGSLPRLIAMLNAEECAEVANTYPATVHTSPSVQYVRAGGFAPVLRISNHLTKCQFHETVFYKEIFQRMGWKDQLGIAVRIEEGTLEITFHRDSDYSSDEANLAGVLHQHIKARFQGPVAPTAPRTFSEEKWDVPLAADLAVLALPIYLEALFQDYFPSTALVKQDVPVPLRRWLRSCAATSKRNPGGVSHMRISARHGALLLWFKPAFRDHPAVLSILEKKSRYEFSRLNQLGLTDRQIDIAFWLTQGKTDAEMATLLEISPRTISKHVESVLARLDCVNRTAAAVQIVEWLSGVNE